MWQFTQSLLTTAIGGSHNLEPYVPAYAAFAGVIWGVAVAVIYVALSAQTAPGFNKINMLTSVITVISVVLSVLLNWSNSVYPYLPPAVGGGKSVSIQFSISDLANEQQFKAIGINIDSNLHVTEPVQFLVETNDALLVLLPNGSAARIDKKLVTNFRYTRPISSTSSLTLTAPISATSTISTPLQFTPSP